MADEYKVLLDPELGVTAEQLARAWAAIPECEAAGEIRIGRSGSKSFSMDPASVALVAVIGAVAGGLAKDFIMLLVKRAVERADAAEEKRKAEEVEVTTVPDPETGLPIIRVSKRGE